MRLFFPLPIIIFACLFYYLPSKEGRLPASFGKAKSCKDVLDNYLDDRKVKKEIKENREELLSELGDKSFADYVSNSWKYYHQNKYKWSKSLSSMRTKFWKNRIKNDSFYVPRLFQTTERTIRGKDVLKTIIHVSDGRLKLLDREVNAIEEVYLWLEELKLFKKRIHNSLFIEAFDYKLQLESFSSNIEKMGINKKYDFPSEGVDIPYTEFVRVEGETFGRDKLQLAKRMNSSFTAYTWTDIEMFQSRLEYKIRPLFTQRKKGLKGLVFRTPNLFGESRFNEIFQGQANLYRVVELVYEKLNITSKNKLAQEQLKLLSDLEEFLLAGEYAPRVTEMARIHSKEYWAEVRGKWLRYHADLFSDDSDLDLPPEMKKGIKMVKSQFTANIMNGAFIFMYLGGFVATTVTALQAIISDNPWISYWLSSISNFYHKVVHGTIGTSKLMKDCENVTSKKLLEGGSGYKVVNSILSKEIAKRRLDFPNNGEDGNPEDKEEFHYERFNLLTSCVVSILEKGRVEQSNNVTKTLKQQVYAASSFMMFSMIAYHELDLNYFDISMDEYNRLIGAYFFYNDYVVTFEKERDFRNDEKTKDVRIALQNEIGQEKADRLFVMINNYYKTMKDISLVLDDLDIVVDNASRMREFKSTEDFLNELIRLKKENLDTN